MKLSDTILTAMSKYPSLYQRPDQVLDSLYLVIGTGFEWENGQLVYDGDPQEPVNTVFVPWDEEVETFRAAYEKDIIKYGREFTTEDAIKHLIEDRIRTLSTYGISEKYSHCYNVPEDADPDWVAGAYMILRYILDDTKFNNSTLKLSPDYSRDFTKRKNHLDSQRTKAQKAKDALDAQFDEDYWKDAYTELETFVKTIETLKELDKFNAEWEIDAKYHSVKPREKKIEETPEPQEFQTNIVINPPSPTHCLNADGKCDFLQYSHNDGYTCPIYKEDLDGGITDGDDEHADRCDICMNEGKKRCLK